MFLLLFRRGLCLSVWAGAGARPKQQKNKKHAKSRNSKKRNTAPPLPPSLQNFILSKKHPPAQTALFGREACCFFCVWKGERGGGGAGGHVYSFAV